jgi:hypothetical protein
MIPGDIGIYTVDLRRENSMNTFEVIQISDNLPFLRVKRRRVGQQFMWAM